MRAYCELFPILKTSISTTSIRRWTRTLHSHYNTNTYKIGQKTHWSKCITYLSGTNDDGTNTGPYKWITWHFFYFWNEIKFIKRMHDKPSTSFRLSISRKTLKSLLFDDFRLKCTKSVHHFVQFRIFNRLLFSDRSFSDISFSCSNLCLLQFAADLKWKKHRSHWCILKIDFIWRTRTSFHYFRAEFFA